MEIKLNIPEYNPENGIEYKWEPDFYIDVKYDNGVVYINANKAGLISLANHLLNLSQDKIPLNYHLHLDENNSLEDGSNELIIKKNDFWLIKNTSWKSHDLDIWLF